MTEKLFTGTLNHNQKKKKKKKKKHPFPPLFNVIIYLKGGLRWFAVVCGGLRYFDGALLYGDVSVM